MNRKKKIHLVVILPTLITLLIVSGLFVLILVAGTGKANSASSYVPSAANNGSTGVAEEAAPPSEQVVEGSSGGVADPGRLANPVNGDVPVSSPGSQPIIVAPGSDNGGTEDAPGVVEGSPGQAGTGITSPPDVVPPDMKPQLCDFKQWVGKPVDEAAVKATERPYRILKPDSMVTEDYSPSRINVIIDDKNVVTEVRCG